MRANLRSCDCHQEVLARNPLNRKLSIRVFHHDNCLENFLWFDFLKLIKENQLPKAIENDLQSLTIKASGYPEEILFQRFISPPKLAPKLAFLLFPSFSGCKRQLIYKLINLIEVTFVWQLTKFAISFALHLDNLGELKPNHRPTCKPTEKSSEKAECGGPQAGGEHRRSQDHHRRTVC